MSYFNGTRPAGDSTRLPSLSSANPFAPAATPLSSLGAGILGSRTVAPSGAGLLSLPPRVAPTFSPAAPIHSRRFQTTEPDYSMLDPAWVAATREKHKLSFPPNRDASIFLDSAVLYHDFREKLENGDMANYGETIEAIQFKLYTASEFNPSSVQKYDILFDALKASIKKYGEGTSKDDFCWIESDLKPLDKLLGFSEDDPLARARRFGMLPSLQSSGHPPANARARGFGRLPSLASSARPPATRLVLGADEPESPVSPTDPFGLNRPFAPSLRERTADPMLPSLHSSELRSNRYGLGADEPKSPVSPTELLLLRSTPASGSSLRDRTTDLAQRTTFAPPASSLRSPFEPSETERFLPPQSNNSLDLGAALRERSLSPTDVLLSSSGSFGFPSRSTIPPLGSAGSTSSLSSFSAQKASSGGTTESSRSGSSFSAAAVPSFPTARPPFVPASLNNASAPAATSALSSLSTLPPLKPLEPLRKLDAISRPAPLPDTPEIKRLKHAIQNLGSASAEWALNDIAENDPDLADRLRAAMKAAQLSAIDSVMASGSSKTQSKQN